jgi:hypothetical protein
MGVDDVALALYDALEGEPLGAVPGLWLWDALEPVEAHG